MDNICQFWNGWELTWVNHICIIQFHQNRSGRLGRHTFIYLYTYAVCIDNRLIVDEILNI